MRNHLGILLKLLSQLLQGRRGCQLLKGLHLFWCQLNGSLLSFPFLLGILLSHSVIHYVVRNSIDQIINRGILVIISSSQALFNLWSWETHFHEFFNEIFFVGMSLNDLIVLIELLWLLRRLLGCWLWLLRIELRSGCLLGLLLWGWSFLDDWIRLFFWFYSCL